MKFSPLPYSFRTTCRLIKRDLKNLVKRITEPNGLQDRFHTIDGYPAEAAYAPNDYSSCSSPVIGLKPQPRVPQTPVQVRHGDVQSIPTTVSTVAPVMLSPLVSSTGTSPSTATEYSSAGESECSSDLVERFPYAEAYPKLKQWYEARPREELSIEDRWILRGIVMVMAIAFCYSPENSAYEAILSDLAPPREGSEADNCKSVLSALLSSLDGDRRGVETTVNGFLAVFVPRADPRKLLLGLGDPGQSTRAAQIQAELHDKFGALLLPEHSRRN